MTEITSDLIAKLSIAVYRAKLRTDATIGEFNVKTPEQQARLAVPVYGDMMRPALLALGYTDSCDFLD